jgi:hypothetical protein
MKKPILTYRITVNEADSIYTYGSTLIDFWDMEPRSVVKRIAKCAADPSYYGDPSHYEPLARLGHEVYYSTPFGPTACLRWQHYTCEKGYEHGPAEGDESYCSHGIEKLDGFRDMRWAAKVLTRLSRGIAKAQDGYYGPKEDYSSYLDSPAAVVRALEAIGAQRVEEVNTGPSRWEFCNATSDLPIWRGSVADTPEEASCPA